MSDQEPALPLASLLQGARSAVVFTGAGMSTESGLPDFRSANGLWTNNRRFEDLASRDALTHDYAAFTDFYRWRITELAKYAPHEGHAILARWEAAGRVRTVITQNVDGFHHRAGSQRVAELHGTLRLVRCERCKREEPAAAFLADPAECACGGKRRPGVVLFGERLPHDALALAEEASTQADLFVVLGSSLLVSPANWFPRMAKEAGARLVIVNHEPTPLDDLADLVVRASVRDALIAVDAHGKAGPP